MSFEDRTELNKRKERIELNSYREIFLKNVLAEEMGRRKYVPENPTLMHRIGHRQPVKIERQKRVAKGKVEILSTDRLVRGPFRLRFPNVRPACPSGVFTQKRLPLWIKKSSNPMESQQLSVKHWSRFLNNSE